MNVPFHMVRPTGEGEADKALVLRGLRVLVGGPEEEPGVPAGGAAGGGSSLAEINDKVNGFLAYAQTIQLDPSRQVLALTVNAAGQEIIAGMCLWVPSAGRTAMLFGPGLSQYPQAAAATQAAIEGATADARSQGVLLVQAMMEPADAAGKTVFS